MKEVIYKCDECKKISNNKKVLVIATNGSTVFTELSDNGSCTEVRKVFCSKHCTKNYFVSMWVRND